MIVNLVNARVNERYRRATNKFKQEKNNSHATNLESSQYLINSEDTVAVDDLRKQEKKKAEKMRNQCKKSNANNVE